ncbi:MULTISPECIES: DUF2971 domain-containing protein [Bacteroides]|jgi:hypothetical protein|uniref:DUF2971 domain-containing protein n=1 Tax=Bacteroides TaxID=816 RepID=UPI000E739614|nr:MULTISPECIES: DUF2971 domain-containing protein [Bacteroides]RJV05918.1 DUF2971 domain-containing protein [Bacteroides sp. AF29-11]
MNKVYKYRANIALSDNGKKRDISQLHNNLFYAATFRELNDPFEGSVELPKSDIHEKWVTPLIQDTYNVGIYSLSKPKDDEKFPCNELLWAHYANSHQGFCIEYDLDLLMENTSPKFDIRNKINVVYDRERPTVVETDNLFQVQQKVFGTKSTPWEYENEVRLVFDKNGVKPIAKNAVTAIYLGLNISFENRQEIIKTFHSCGIDIYQIERIDNLYRLKATKLKFDFDSFEIVNVNKRLLVDNYMILYGSENKDKHSLKDFVLRFRKTLKRPSNITIIDDIRAKEILLNYKPRNEMSQYEKDIQANHWIGYSSFDAPELVMTYPDK